MSKEKTAKVMGRPVINLDWEIIYGLCEHFCTLEEIAAICRVSEDTVERRCKDVNNETFADYRKRAASGGKASLRRTQYQVALAGNTTMLKWLGQNEMGQSEVQKIDHTTRGNDIISGMSDDEKRDRFEKMKRVQDAYAS